MRTSKKGLVWVLFALTAGCAEEPVVQQPVPVVFPALIHETRPTEVVGPDGVLSDEKLPLVIMLHGYGANAAVQDQFIFKLADQVQEHNFVLLLPDGTTNSDKKRFWNATPECCNFDNSTVDDVAFIGELIDLAVQELNVDRERVSLVGHSNGGYMSYRFACERPEAVDRIVVLAGSTFLNEADCKGSEPVSVLHIHGTSDNTILYDAYGLDGTADGDGATAVGTDVDGVTAVGAEEAIARWWRKAGCSPEPVQLPNIDATSSVAELETEVYQWQDCADGIDIRFWKVNGGNHFFLETKSDFQDGISAFLFGESEE